MQVRALKTFDGRLGLVRTGAVITVDKQYGNQLIRSGLAALFIPSNLEPDSNVALDGPNSTKNEGDEGNESSDEAGLSHDRDDGSMEDSSAGPRAGGRAKLSSAQLQGRRSRKRT